MKWHHIRDKQPEHYEEIIQLDNPSESDHWSISNHYLLSHTRYVQLCSWQDMKAFCKSNNIDPPNFWWISAKDFPFPCMANKESQTCTFCLNPDSILTERTCCTGCSKLKT